MIQPYESCFAFLFELYIKQSQVWETLPRPKMELFVTIGICKVIYFRYFTYSIAKWVSLFALAHYWFLVPFRSMWFQRLTSKTVLFLTISIANAVFWWTMVLGIFYEFLVFCVSSLQSPSCYRCSQLVWGSFR